LVTYFLNLIKGSAQRELDSFFSVIYPDDSLSQQITKSALSQARKKLSPKVFMDLNQLVVDTFYGDTKTTSRWKGFRLCAVDGSQFRLPNVTNIVEAFGVHKGKESQKSEQQTGHPSQRKNRPNKFIDVIHASKNWFFWVKYRQYVRKYEENPNHQEKHSCVILSNTLIYLSLC